LNTVHPIRQALILWAIFFILAVVLNGTIPFLIGADLHAWISSTVYRVLFPLLIYGGVFLVNPLILIKGWQTVRQPAFLVPLLLALAAISLWYVLRGIAVVAVLVLAYLHWRYDLSGLGLRSFGWKGDMGAILLYGLLGVLPNLLRLGTFSFVPGSALLAGLDRLFANPASSIENLFYFGFLAERMSLKTGKWLTPAIIGLMYTAHEMTNPEYWYGGMNFSMTFVGVILVTALYQWRRNIIPIWLGDGLRRFFTAFF